MKQTKRIWKTGMIAVASAWSMSAWSQPTLPGDYVTFQKTGETVDTVTVGSRMAYRVKGDPVIAAMPATVMDPSYFKWKFGGGTVVIKDIGGSNISPQETDYYSENEISAVMPATPGSLTLTTAEKTRPKIGTGCESGDSTANILVVAKPTLKWPTTKEVGGCVAGSVDIDLTLTGYSQWEVTYDLQYTPYSGTVPPPTTGQKATIGSDKKMTIASVTFANPGKYEIKVTNLSDRISRKSLDVINAAAGTDIPAANDLYTIHVYPTPQTHRLEHVKNL